MTLNGFNDICLRFLKRFSLGVAAGERRTPSVQTVAKIAKALSVSIEKLIQ